MSILDYVPDHYTARPEQADILQQVEKYWQASDVLVIPGKVGIGKSVIAVTIARWRAAMDESAALITPRVALQDQYTESFPDMPMLKGKSRYMCHKWEISCADAQEINPNKKFCKACPFTVARIATSTSKVAGFNINSYYYNKTPREVVIFDEAHLVHDFLSDHFTLMLWQHKDKYPDDMKTAGDVAVWLESRIPELTDQITKLGRKGLKEEALVASKTLRRYTNVRNGLAEAPANFFLEDVKESYRGKKMRGMRIRPASLIGLRPILWPEKTTKKLVLMSGTLSTVDLRRLALFRKRIKWINCHNPIAPKQRPVDASWGINMSYKYQDQNVEELCGKLLELAEEHHNNGIIHTTYGLAEKMKPFLKGPRFMWHDSDNKEEQLALFQATPGAILVACGMSEGIDLAGRQYDWQAITKVMYPNKSDQLIDKWYREDKDWIYWLTVRTILQQTGRIVRSPDDYGITYILDSAFGNPVKKRRGLWTWAGKFIPEDYVESIKWR